MDSITTKGGVDSKSNVHAYWNDSSCGETLYLDNNDREGYLQHTRKRYELESYIGNFAQFDKWSGRDVLEIGVGLGADHQQFATHGAILTGIDLTERAVEHTRRRFNLFKIKSNILVGDAENLPFGDESFDLVYSWGVLHHSPDTPKAIREVLRVLRPGGTAKVMIYHKWSIVGFMLWLRYALMRGRPFMSLEDIYANYLESPGTKAYSAPEARKLFSGFSQTHVSTVLTHGDLLSSEVGQRHRGWILSLAKMIWPRWLIRAFFPNNGLFMLITAIK